MIFPWLKDIRLSLWPMSWVLLLLNIIFFITIRVHDSKYNFDETLKIKDQVLVTAGKLAQQVYQSYELPFWSQLLIFDTDQESMLLGAFALRQDTFLHRLNSTPTHHDEIAKQELTIFLSQLEAYKKDSHSLNFALQPEAITPWSWITYQFSHSDLIHLISNMTFLFLFGFLIEAQVGAGVLSIIYILGGIFGGLYFLIGQGSSPVIGASASVSALVAFFILYNWSQKIPMFYFFAPLKGYMGLIYLPAYVLVPLLVIDDFIQVLTSMDGLSGGVAHSAHVGGLLFGGLFALFIKSDLSLFLRRSKTTT